jgi:hypothetical protein
MTNKKKKILTNIIKIYPLNTLKRSYQFYLITNHKLKENRIILQKKK